jgi:hypothetical protein
VYFPSFWVARKVREPRVEVGQMPYDNVKGAAGRSRSRNRDGFVQMVSKRASSPDGV